MWREGDSNRSEVMEIFLEIHGVIQFSLVCAGYYLLKFVLWGLPNRVLRTIKVCVKGWPPAHLDADGDWEPDRS